MNQLTFFNTDDQGAEVRLTVTPHPDSVEIEIETGRIGLGHQLGAPQVEALCKLLNQWLAEAAG